MIDGFASITAQSTSVILQREDFLGLIAMFSAANRRDTVSILKVIFLCKVSLVRFRLFVHLKCSYSRFSSLFFCFFSLDACVRIILSGRCNQFPL